MRLFKIIIYAFRLIVVIIAFIIFGIAWLLSEITKRINKLIKGKEIKND